MMAVIACWKANTTKTKKSKALYDGSHCGILHNLHREVDDGYFNLNFLMGDQGRVDLLAIVVGNAPEKSCVLNSGALIGGWGISCNHVLP
jgi:hypothetical protein